MTARKHDGAACPIAQPRSQPDGYSSPSSTSRYNWTWLSSSCSIDLHFPPEVPPGLTEVPQDFKIVTAITTEKQPARHCLLHPGAAQLTAAAGSAAFPGCLLTRHCPSCTEMLMRSRGEMAGGKKNVNTVGIAPAFVESKPKLVCIQLRNVDHLLLNSFKNCPALPCWFLVAARDGKAWAVAVRQGIPTSSFPPAPCAPRAELAVANGCLQQYGRGGGSPRRPSGPCQWGMRERGEGSAEFEDFAFLGAGL